MWSRAATLGAVLTMSACASSTAPEAHAPIVSTALDVNVTPETGVFHAVFWNHDQLSSPQLSDAFRDALRNYCGKMPTMLTDQVIITADERSPQVKTEGLFRCEKADT